MGLFLESVDGEDLGYRNIRDGILPIERQIRQNLENLWCRFEPYADTQFRTEFARQPSERFWEMHLGCWLLDQGKQIVARSELTRAAQGNRPDFCVVEDGRRIWIEAICPNRGSDDNPDQIPDFMANAKPGEVQVFAAPNREIDLRLTSALLEKSRRYQRYKTSGVVGPDDTCLVAISGGQLRYAGPTGMFCPPARAFYPIGNEYVTFDRSTGEVVDSGFQKSVEIGRSGPQGGASIPRTAFLESEFEHLAGVIWSRAGIGNDTYGVAFLPNAMARNSLPERWAAWDAEYRVREEEDHFVLHLLDHEPDGRQTLRRL